MSGGRTCKKVKKREEEESGEGVGGEEMDG